MGTAAVLATLLCKWLVAHMLGILAASSGMKL